MDVTRHEDTFRGVGGYGLATTWYAPPDNVAVRATLVIASATAVKRSYYRAFASAMAEAGLRTVTFDYRGIGGSAPATLRGFSATMQAWAEQDLDGVLLEVDRRWPNKPVLYLGHSFGGQALGLLRNTGRVRAAVLVASQSGYWRLWRGVGRARVIALWFGIIPVLTRVLGYLPGKRLGLGEDQPAGVARQWARWGRHPQYILSAGPDVLGRFARVALPIRAYTATDDDYAPRAAAEALLAFYSNATVEHRHLHPRDLVVGRIDHFGFFRETFRDNLWREIEIFLLDYV